MFSFQTSKNWAVPALIEAHSYPFINSSFSDNINVHDLGALFRCDGTGLHSAENDDCNKLLSQLLSGSAPFLPQRGSQETPLPPRLELLNSFFTVSRGGASVVLNKGTFQRGSDCPHFFAE